MVYHMGKWDLYGGWTGLRFEATDYFRLDQAHGRWWFVTPAGHAFLSHGVNHVGEGLLKYPYNRDHWAKQFGLSSVGDADFLAHFYEKVRRDMVATGWNTLSCHNPDHLFEHVRQPYIPTVRFVDICHWMTPKSEDFLDVWSAEFETHCDGIAREWVAPRAEDPYLLGYSMTDCPVWSDLDAAARETCIFGAKREALTTWPRRLRNLNANAAGKDAYVACMQDLYAGQIADFNATYGTTFATFDALVSAQNWREEVDPQNARERYDNAQFLNLTVDKYYEVVTGVIRKHDPNHMVFGDKLNGNTDVSDDLLKVVAKYCDILFWQHYAHSQEHRMLLDRGASVTGLPQMNGDASLSSPDEHVTNPLGPHLQTQEARAKAYGGLVRDCYKRSDFLGWNWCGWLDRWEVVQPMRQHSGVQDAFGNFYPIVNEMHAFSQDMYQVAIDTRLKT